MKRILVAFAVVLLLSSELEAQCAMCKAVLESDMSRDGVLVSRSINDGILYLMGFPYIAMFGVAAYIFRDHIKRGLGWGTD